jgi:hypothetical protein
MSNLNIRLRPLQRYTSRGTSHLSCIRFYASQTAPISPRIVSRRLRQLQQEAVKLGAASHDSWLTTLRSTFSRRKSDKNTALGGDEKPWPLSVRIAGYIAIVAALPMSLCTLVAESKAFRVWLEGDRPHDPNDRRIGKWIVTFTRAYWADNNLFHGELEADLEREKRTAVEVATNLDRDVPVHVYLINQPVMTISLKGNIPISLSSAAVSGMDYDAGSIFAVEFPEEGGEVGTPSWSIPEKPLEEIQQHELSWQDKTTDSNDHGSIVHMLAKSYGGNIRELTQTFSSWHVFEQDSAQESKLYAERMSPENIRKSELEWREAQLKMQLIDPYCNRDIDEMQLELAQVQRELRRLNRWKWAKSILSR